MSHLFFLQIIEFKFFKKKVQKMNHKNEGCDIFRGQMLNEEYQFDLFF